MPYERFLRFGAESLTDAELLSLVLRNGSKDKDVFTLSREILSSDPNEGLLNLHRLSAEELTRIGGIGMITAVKLKSIAQIAIRMAKQEKQAGKCIFSSSSQIAASYMERFRHEAVEKSFLLMLDHRLHLLKEEVLTVGTAKQALICPRELFSCALRNQAVYVILLHNHPAGDPAPSVQDKQITLRLRDLGNMLEIPLLDHIILGDRTYYSFKEKGAL